MTRYGMLIDTGKCIGCYTCRIACQTQNHLSAESSFVRFEQRETGVYPQVGVETIPIQCMHCDDAPCAAVCPTGAAKKGADGIVEVDQGRCIGCLYCMAACPYQVRVRDSRTGVVDKCRFCEVSNYITGIQKTTCVSACPTQARIFGDLDDPQSEISKSLSSLGGRPLAGDLTQVKVFYVR